MHISGLEDVIGQEVIMTHLCVGYLTQLPLNGCSSLLFTSATLREMLALTPMLPVMENMPLYENFDSSFELLLTLKDSGATRIAFANGSPC